MRLWVIAFILATSSVAATAEEKSSATKFATATAVRRPVSVYSGIAVREVPLPGNEVAPPGFPIGEEAFVVKVGEKVAVVDIFPNGGESRYTCKVRNQTGKFGFLMCISLEMQEWSGERGAIVRILLEQPYEYEGDLAGRMEDMGKLEDFISQYPTSRFIPFAKLTGLSLRCGMTLSLAQNVWGSLQDLREHGSLSGSETRMDVKWTPETSQLYTSLEKQESERRKEIRDLCSLVSKLKKTVVAPVSLVGER